MTAHEASVKQFIETDECHCWQDAGSRRPPRGFTLDGFLAFLSREERPKQLRFLADGWDIDFNTHTVYLLEVIGSKGISRQRQKQLEIVFWLLDSADFRLSLVVYDEILQTTLDVPFEHMALWVDHGAKGVPWLPIQSDSIGPCVVVNE